MNPGAVVDIVSEIGDPYPRLGYGKMVVFGVGGFTMSMQDPGEITANRPPSKDSATSYFNRGWGCPDFSAFPGAQEDS